MILLTLNGMEWGLHLWSASKCHYDNTDADEESDDKFNHMRTFNLRKDYIYIEYGIGFDTG